MRILLREEESTASGFCVYHGMRKDADSNENSLAKLDKEQALAAARSACVSQASR